MEKLKEIYRMWWEYLKMSDDYKRECERRRVCQSCDKKEVERFKIGHMVGMCVGCDETDPPIFPYYISDRYSWFGDIYNDSFDMWWEKNKEFIEGKGTSIVIDGIKKDIDYCIDSFKSKEGREPTLKEFKDIFLKEISNAHWPVIYMKVYVYGSTVDDLTKQFVEIVKKRKEEPNVKQYEIEYKKYRKQPITDSMKKKFYYRIKELERYLKVYKLRIKEKLPMSDVISTFDPNPNIDNKDVNVQRVYYQHLQRAKKLIKNAEKGNFPGDYQP